MENLIGFENTVRIINAIRDWSSSVESLEGILSETEKNLNELSRIISELKVLNGGSNTE